jgi:hypothetical protein
MKSSARTLETDATLSAQMKLSARMKVHCRFFENRDMQPFLIESIRRVTIP